MVKQPVEGYDGQLVSKTRLTDPEPGIRLFQVTYLSQGLRVKGYLIIPASESPLPALIYCRGGIRSVGMVRVTRVLTLAKHGYVIFAPFYRGNEGGDGREDFGGEDRYDVYHAIPFIQSLSEVSQGSVAVLGFSRGAMMALLAARDCTAVGPVVVWGGVSDLFLTYEERVDLRRMLKRVVGHPKKQPEAYESRSPVYWVKEMNKPVLIIHGKEDDKVGVEHAYRLANELEKQKTIFAMHIFDGMGHTFSKSEDQQALAMVFDWIEKHRY
jgi:dipeptidyl aminopeptidase/acylaminoacyl peptidase